MKLEKKVWLFTLCLILELPWAAAQTTAAPTTPTPMAASAATAVPPMIPYSGTALDTRGNALTGEDVVTFLIYKSEQGGEPLFAETQTVIRDRSGQYKVQLGASLSNGIPIDLFASGEARWLEVQIAGEQPQPRVLLVSVPYALKAADAATLGGLPASAFALAGSNAVANMTSAGSPPTPHRRSPPPEARRTRSPNSPVRTPSSIQFSMTTAPRSVSGPLLPLRP